MVDGVKLASSNREEALLRKLLASNLSQLLRL